MTAYITPFSVVLLALLVIIAHACVKHFSGPRARTERMQRRALDLLERKQRESQRFPK